MATKNKKIGKEALTVNQVIQLGHPRRMVQEDINGDHFSEFGFRYGRTRYIFIADYEKFLKRRTEEQEQAEARRRAR